MFQPRRQQPLLPGADPDDDGGARRPDRGADDRRQARAAADPRRHPDRPPLPAARQGHDGAARPRPRRHVLRDRGRDAGQPEPAASRTCCRSSSRPAPAPPTPSPRASSPRSRNSGTSCATNLAAMPVRRQPCASRRTEFWKLVRCRRLRTRYAASGDQGGSGTARIAWMPAPSPSRRGPTARPVPAAARSAQGLGRMVRNTTPSLRRISPTASPASHSIRQQAVAPGRAGRRPAKRDSLPPDPPPRRRASASGRIPAARTHSREARHSHLGLRHPAPSAALRIRPSSDA